VAKSLVVVESPTKVKTIQNIWTRDSSSRRRWGTCAICRSRSSASIPRSTSSRSTSSPRRRRRSSTSSRRSPRSPTRCMSPPTRPRGRGHRLAPRPGAAGRQEEDLPHHLQRDHRARREGGLHQAGQDRHAQGRRPASAACARPARGYSLSPLLWDKVRRGLSAGRVQSVAVRLIVDREREIEAFVPVEYWSLHALLTGKRPPQFEATAARVRGEKASLTNEADTRALMTGLEAGRSSSGRSRA